MPRKPRVFDRTPRDRFIRIAQPRVKTILAQLRLLGGMNRGEYGPPSPADVEFMLGAIEQGLGELKEAFRRTPGTPNIDFRFDRQDNNNAPTVHQPRNLPSRNKH